mmetsp:Transcript_6188/g.17622  ORF Transcript_6188/g.17622 Transcript_6188/m.17622 type:complete len:305 (+) Transcript_6188:1442-2356(+)
MQRPWCPPTSPVPLGSLRGPRQLHLGTRTAAPPRKQSHQSHLGSRSPRADAVPRPGGRPLRRSSALDRTLPSAQSSLRWRGAAEPSPGGDAAGASQSALEPCPARCCGRGTPGRCRQTPRSPGAPLSAGRRAARRSPGARTRPGSPRGRPGCRRPAAGPADQAPPPQRACTDPCRAGTAGRPQSPLGPRLPTPTSARRRSRRWGTRWWCGPCPGRGSGRGPGGPRSACSAPAHRGTLGTASAAHASASQQSCPPGRSACRPGRVRGRQSGAGARPPRGAARRGTARPRTAQGTSRRGRRGHTPG